MCGRVTMERDFSDGPYTHKGSKVKKAEDHIADPSAKSFAVAIDARGKLAWKENNIDGDHLIEILTEQISQSYVDYLRSLNISYVLQAFLKLTWVLPSINWLQISRSKRSCWKAVAS